MTSTRAPPKPLFANSFFAAARMRFCVAAASRRRGLGFANVSIAALHLLCGLHSAQSRQTSTASYLAALTHYQHLDSGEHTGCFIKLHAYTHDPAKDNRHSA